MKHLIFYPGIFTLLVSCMPTASPTTDPKDNDAWVYRYKDYNESGSLVSTNDYFFSGDANNPNGAVEVDDTISPAGIFPSLVPYGVYKMSNEGLYHYTNLELGGVPRMFLKYPANNGDTYQWTTNVQGVYLANVTVTSTSDTVTVPDGFYSNLHTYQYISTLGSTQGSIWFNDSVWFVKYQCFDSLTSGTGLYLDYSYELVDYIANP